MLTLLGFMPHGHCFMWNAKLLLLTVGSDIAIGLAYFSIPVLLYTIRRDRKDFPFSHLLSLFGLFILACGSTHFVAAWNMWHSNYWLEAALKVLTAGVSVMTVVVLYRAYSDIVGIASPQQLEQEIEKRKVAEAKLTALLGTRTEERDSLRTLTEDIVEALPGGLIATDEKGCITHFNRAAEEIIGRPTSDSSSKKWSDECSLYEFKRDELLAEEDFPLARSLSGDVVTGRRIRVRPAVGSDRVITCNSAPLSAGGAVVMFHDVSEAAALERRLIRSNEDLERFAHVASHDLREPIRGVIGCLGMLEHVTTGKLEGEAQEFLDHAKLSASRMGEMVEGLLTYSTLGQDKVKPSEVDCHQVVDSIVKDLGVARVSLVSLPKVHGHKPLLIRLFQNLISNALKYCSPERELELKIEFKDGIFAVHDNGMGIEEKYLRQIFEVFRRLHTQEEIPGTGLGLAMCERIVNQHSGEIWAKSTPGEGSSFFFSLGCLEVTHAVSFE